VVIASAKTAVYPDIFNKMRLHVFEHFFLIVSLEISTGHILVEM
jgi:hypothetical protein